MVRVLLANADSCFDARYHGRWTESCRRYFPQRPNPARRRNLPIVSVAEEQAKDVSTAGQTTETPVEPTSGAVCQFCGVSQSEVPGGCDGQGRIAGGLGAVLGFDWWPIKAYRPCPAASKKGLRYRRKGQITDEMLFGRGTGGKS
eukprot:jgi/Botrbrau1/13476/Bobra.0082s0073.1